MNKEEIINNNGLIAEFMGGYPFWQDKTHTKITGFYLPYLGKYENTLTGDFYERIENLAYNYSWDWLMPVVIKIEEDIDVDKIANGHGQGYKNQVQIFLHSCTIEPTNWGSPLIEQIIGETKIEAAYKAVIEFIKWYNENKTKKN